jgi:predicted metal-dependent hydrolase
MPGQLSGQLSGQLGLFDSRGIALGEHWVEFRFLRRRRRTIGLTVDARGLTVAAPKRVAWRDIESFIRDKERWILDKLQEWAGAPRAQVLELRSGETLPLFGEQHVLEVCDGGRAVRREAGRLVVSAPAPRRVAEILVGWLKDAALETLVPRVEHFAAALGLPAPAVELSSARSQWGVCTEGGPIRLNWRLVHLEPRLADYVVAHEVAHLREMNHSKRFWAQVGALYPAWREAREQLELKGAALPIIGGKP